MHRIDRWLGLTLAVLAAAVLATARSFPSVPGQKLGAGFLPTLVGAGLMLCALGLIVRSVRAGARAAAGADAAVPPSESYGSALVICGVVAVYVFAAEPLGFLLVAPLALVVVFRALGVAWVPSLAWALGGTLVVHVAFYKLLRVPLPWGLLRPFY